MLKKGILLTAMVFVANTLQAGTVVKDAYLEDFPTGLWTGTYRYISCEDKQVEGEGSAHLTVDRVLLDDDVTRITIGGTLSLIGFPDNLNTPNYARGVRLNASQISRKNSKGTYDVQLNLERGPSFTADNGYQPIANTLIAALGSCDGNPYQIYVTVHPPEATSNYQSP